MVRAGALQGIDVEELRAVLGHAREHAIVERALQHVGITRVAVEQGQPMRPLRKRDGGAGLLVGGEVRQVVIHGESLVVRARADAAGEVFVALRGVAPDPIEHSQQPLVTGPGRNLRGARHQVSRADGMALDGLVIVDRHIVLPVGAVILVQGGLVLGRKELPAAVFDEEPREVEIAGVAGRAREFDQGQFDFRMARVAQPLGRRTKDRVNAVREAGGDVQEVCLARGLVMGRGGLKHVARTVKFVPVAQVRPAFVRLLDGEVAVQVAVRLLCRRKQGDDVVHPLVQRRIRVRGQ